MVAGGIGLGRWDEWRVPSHAEAVDRQHCLIDVICTEVSMVSDI